jgi:hypothetical protein
MNDVFITYRHFRLEEYNRVSDLVEYTPKGGVTLAFFVDLRDPDNKFAIAGYAVCSKHDHFCKETGRKQAYSRLNEARRALKYADSDSWYRSIFTDLKFQVQPKDEAGTLCNQFLIHLLDLSESGALIHGSEAQVLVQYFKKHNIL